MLTAMSIPQAVSQAERPAIQVQGLEKSYKELRVLRGRSEEHSLNSSHI